MLRPSWASEVWKAFTTRAGIESWIVGAGDVRPAHWWIDRTSYQKGSDPDGDAANAAIHQEILSLDPERMLSYRVVKSPKNFPFPQRIGGGWTTVYVESIDRTHTRVVARMLGYTSDAESQKMRAFLVTGNTPRWMRS